MIDFEEGKDDENDNDEIEAEDDDDDDEFDDDLEDEEDDEEDEEDDEIDDLDDDDEEDTIELSINTEIPLVQEKDSPPEVDLETLGEVEPRDITDASWEELLGEDFDFSDLVDMYGIENIYEVEIGIDYENAA